MTLPATVFSPAPRQDGAEEPGSPYSATNGVICNTEGERRRKEMLGIALKLERRYAYLLPPERLRKAHTPASSAKNVDEDDCDDERDSVTSLRQHASTLAISPALLTPRKYRTYATVSTYTAPTPHLLNENHADLATSHVVATPPPTPPELAESLFTPPPSAVNDSPIGMRQEYVNDDVSMDDKVPFNDGSNQIEDTEMAISEVVKESEPCPQEPSPKKRGRKPKTVAVSEVQAQTAVIMPEQPPKRRRGRKPKWLILHDQESDAAPAGGSDVSPVTKEIQFRFHQASFSAPSDAVDVQRDQCDSSEEAPAQPREMETTSARPKKQLRIRKEDEPASAPTSRTQSDWPTEKGTAISAAVTSVRGKTYVSYIDSRTGETVRSTSFLIIASVRAVEKTNIRKARDTCSFGVQTPEFGKMAPMDYELQEEILYRNFKDRSPNGCEIVVPFREGEDRLQRRESVEETIQQSNDGNSRGGCMEDVGDAMNTEFTEKECFSTRSDSAPSRDTPWNVSHQDAPILMKNPKRTRLLHLSQLFDDEPPIVASPDPEPTDLVTYLV